MSFCPKCNNEYPDNLPECPFCSGSNAAEASNNVPAENEDVVTTDNNTPPEFFGEYKNSQTPEPDNGKNAMPLGVVIGVVAAVVVIVAAVIIAVFCFSGNSSGNSSSAASGSTEDMTMPSGYEEIIQNIKDDDGNLITEATDPYGNTVTREVDSDGNIVTTYVGPDGETATVTTDSNGNIIAQDVPSSSNTSSQNNSSASSKNNSSGNTSSSKNNSSGSASSNNSSSSSSGSNNSSSANAPSGEVLINGKSFKVGDTVTFTGTAEGISEAVAGFQFTIDFDENVLELDKDSITLLDGGCIANPDQPGKIMLNGVSVMTGYNFSMPADFIVCKFKVKDSSSKACDIKITTEEAYTGTGSQELVDVTKDVETSITVK